MASGCMAEVGMRGCQGWRLRAAALAALLTGMVWCAGCQSRLGIPGEHETMPPGRLSSAWLEAPSKPRKADRAIPLVLVIRVAPGAHTYADPPGDAGMPPDLQLDLPPGWQRTPLRFPPPARFDEEGILTYGYAGEVRLPFEVVPGRDTPAGEVTLHGRLYWLVCKDLCVPHETQLQASFRVTE